MSLGAGIVRSTCAQLSKYRFMESSTTQKQRSLEAKIPELVKTLETLALLQARPTSCMTAELTRT